MNDPCKLMQMLCGKPSDPQSAINSQGARPRASTQTRQQAQQVPEPRREKRGTRALTSELLTSRRRAGLSFNGYDFFYMPQDFPPPHEETFDFAEVLSEFHNYVNPAYDPMMLNPATGQLSNSSGASYTLETYAASLLIHSGGWSGGWQCDGKTLAAQTYASRVGFTTTATRFTQEYFDQLSGGTTLRTTMLDLDTLSSRAVDNMRPYVASAGAMTLWKPNDSPGGVTVGLGSIESGGVRRVDIGNDGSVYHFNHAVLDSIDVTPYSTTRHNGVNVYQMTYRYYTRMTMRNIAVKIDAAGGMTEVVTGSRAVNGTMQRVDTVSLVENPDPAAPSTFEWQITAQRFQVDQLFTTAPLPSAVPSTLVDLPVLTADASVSLTYQGVVDPLKHWGRYTAGAILPPRFPGSAEFVRYGGQTFISNDRQGPAAIPGTYTGQFARGSYGFTYGIRDSVPAPAFTWGDPPVTSEQHGLASNGTPVPFADARPAVSGQAVGVSVPSAPISAKLQRVWDVSGEPTTTGWGPVGYVQTTTTLGLTVQYSNFNPQ